MNLVLIASLALRIVATLLALRLLRSGGGRRAGVVAAVAGLLALHQAIDLRASWDPAEGVVLFSRPGLVELPGLAVSLLLLALLRALAGPTRAAAPAAGEEVRALLEDVLQAVPAMVAAFDGEGRVIYWNAECERVTGRAAAEVRAGGDQLGRIVADPREGQRLVAAWSRAAPAQVATEFEVAAPDGTARRVAWTNASARAAVPGWTAWGVGADVTEEHGSQAEVERLETELRHARKMEAVGTLAGGVAHDINNLLTAIFGYTGLARDAIEPGHPAQGSLEMVEEGSRRAMEVTRALLAFSRRTAVRPEAVDLVPLLTDSLRLLRRLLPATVRVEEELPRNQELWVRADSVQIQQVLMNLAVGARDSMPSGGDLQVRLRLEGGPGRDPEVVLETVTAPARTENQPAEGELDLTAVHAIVEQHEWSFTSERQADGGHRHQVRLPKIHPPGRKEPADRTARGRSGGATVLLAGDDPYVRSLTLDALRAAGYRVIACIDGDDALRAFEQHGRELDLVVTDQDLPGHTGLDCLRIMRERRPELNGIVATGMHDVELAESEMQGTLLLFKPFQMSALVELVERVLSRAGGATPASRG